MVAALGSFKNAPKPSFPAAGVLLDLVPFLSRIYARPPLDGTFGPWFLIASGHSFSEPLTLAPALSRTYAKPPLDEVLAPFLSAILASKSPKPELFYSLAAALSRIFPRSPPFEFSAIYFKPSKP
jgi:hypothetical protein